MAYWGKCSEEDVRNLLSYEKDKTDLKSSLDIPGKLIKAVSEFLVNIFNNKIWTIYGNLLYELSKKHQVKVDFY